MAAGNPLRRWARVVTDYLPKGQSLPEATWRVRHRTLSWLLRVHVVGIFVFALIMGASPFHAAIDAGAVAIFAVGAITDGRRRRFASAMAALGLVMSSAVLVHVSGGSIEMHFHFFVMVGILTLYQDWQPFLLAIGFVVAHHTILGTVLPDSVYNHPDAISQPFKWALIHGAFVLAASAASVVAWRFNEEQALKDSLTGLPNRRLFHDRVSHALARTQRRPESVAVLFIDLDGFKSVNDSMGHAAGDLLLTTVGERLRASLRLGDTPARFGGDEFAILVEDIDGEDVAVRVARRLVDAMAVPFIVRGKEITLGASVGVAVAIPGDTVDDLLRNADVAMYTAKKRGRNRLEVFVIEMHTAVLDRAELEADLRQAIDRSQLLLHYQPIVSLSSGRLVALEAMLRWQHPEKGLLAPAQFLELAEQTGEIVPIGAWAMREACHQAQLWKARFPSHPFKVCLNVSPAQLLRSDIADTVRDALKGCRFEPSDLVLEVTQGVIVSGAPDSLHGLHGLKALGVHVAVDGFGTDGSSLSSLRRMPVDIVKIDASFIDSITHGDAGAAFARSIIELAQTLQLTTVAEGVEDAQQVAALRQLQCESAQGSYFAKPLPADAVEAVLASASVGDGWTSRLERQVSIKRSPS